MIPTEPIPEAARELRAFVGDWQMQGAMSDSEGRYAMSRLWRFVEGADGWGVIGSMTTEIEGVDALEERELIGLDAVTGRIHMFSMNRLAIRDHVGALGR